MLDGVNSNNPIDEKSYTMQSLNIKPESRAASIFNKIDMSDGTQDNSLTQEQVNKFQQAYLGNMPQDELKDAIGNKVFKKLSESYLQQFVNEDGTYNLNELCNSIKKVLSYGWTKEDVDETKLIKDALKELTGENFSTKETKKILELLGFQQQPNVIQRLLGDFFPKPVRQGQKEEVVKVAETEYEKKIAGKGAVLNEEELKAE